MAVLQKRKVYDPTLRLIHAWNALAVLALGATALAGEAFGHGATRDRLWSVHILAGYALAVGLAARLAWGLVGPGSARFADMWHPAAWTRMALSRRLVPSRRYGHDELASLAYLAVYAVLAVMAGTGLALAAIEQGAGPLAPWLFDSLWLEDLVEEPHEALAWLVGGFVLLHFAGLIYHERIERLPTAQSMLTGYQYRPTAEEVGHA